MITASVIRIAPLLNVTAATAQAAEQQHNPWSLIHANWYGNQPALIRCINALMMYHHAALFARQGNVWQRGKADHLLNSPQMNPQRYK